MKWFKFTALLAVLAALGLSADIRAADAKKIVLIAGTPAYASDPGAHEFNAGVLLLQKCLDQVPGVQAVAYTNGWPSTDHALDDAAAIVIYMTGGTNHLVLQGNHLAQLLAAIQHGAGFAAFHHTLEMPVKEVGADFLDWMGGYFDPATGTKAFWDADFKTLPTHPITRGVRPFKLNDEWYYHLHFQPQGATPILSATPPAPNNGRSPGAQVVAWAYERPDGGRGFGTSGGHYHKNWGDANFRKLVLNGLVWIAHAEVPPEGVPSTVTPEDLARNLDAKVKKP